MSMFEKEPINLMIPPKEISTLEPHCPVSTQAHWITYIRALQTRMNHVLHLWGIEDVVLSSPETHSLESREETYKILDQLRVKNSNKKLIKLIPQNFHHIETSNDNLPKTGVSSTENHPIDYIEELKKKGFDHLIQKLEQHQGHLWDEIKAIHHPILIEQLIDLYQLCLKNDPHAQSSSSHTEKILKFALDLAKTATNPRLAENYSHSGDILNYTKQVIGQLIFLTDHHINTAFKCLNHLTTSEACVNIQTEFSNEIENISYQLQNHYQSHDKTQLQSADLAFHTKIPVVIAQTLLTDLGTINIGIIDILIEKFLSSNPPINHQINLAYGLKLLQSSSKVRADFKQIQAPQSARMPSNDVIRATLNLAPEVPLTDLHAKQTILTALLSHIRQGKEGSCFATSLANEILSTHLPFCLKDLTQMIQESKLTRMIKNTRKDIPFIKVIPDENLNKKFMIDSKGHLFDQDQHKLQAYLWDSPGIQAACLSIGIPDVKKAIDTLIQSLPVSDKMHLLSIKDVLLKLCESIVDLQPEKAEIKGSLFSQACFAFSSQTAQPLLKVWENAIANMAEAQEGSMIKTNILDAILYALQFKLGELHIPPSPLLKQLLQEIKKSLYMHIQLQYDPSLEDQLTEEAYLKSKGGFVLYHQDNRIDSLSSFNRFLIEIILQVNKKFKALDLNDKESKELNHFFDLILPHLQSEEFITRMLVKYHPSNASQLMMNSNSNNIYNKLTFTPWITRTGNNSKTVLEVYLESNEPIQTQKLLSENLEERLVNMIKLEQQLSESEHSSYLPNISQLRIPGWHTGCLILFNHSALTDVIKNNQSAEKWIQDSIKAPGKHVAESILDNETKQRLLTILNQEVLPHFLSKEKLAIFDRLAHDLPESLSIKDYRTDLIKLCRENPDLKPVFILDKLIRQIDTALYQSLEPNLKNQLINSALHLIDTNWCRDIHDIHLCAIVNPGTGELELWETYSNNSHLKAINQKDWLQEWEVFRIPKHLIPTDSNK